MDKKYVKPLEKLIEEYLDDLIGYSENPLPKGDNGLRREKITDFIVKTEAILGKDPVPSLDLALDAIQKILQGGKRNQSSIIKRMADVHNQHLSKLLNIKDDTQENNIEIIHKFIRTYYI